MTIRLSILVVLVAMLLSRHSAAQQPSCSYDECALRVKRGFWGPRLVQGLGEQKVAGFAFLAPSLDELLQRSDSANRYYALFRARHNRGFWLTFVGAALFGVAHVLYQIDQEQEPLAIGLAIGGTGAWAVGLVNMGRSHEPLSKTIWWYNRSLVQREP